MAVRRRGWRVGGRKDVQTTDDVCVRGEERLWTLRWLGHAGGLHGHQRSVLGVPGAQGAAALHAMMPHQRMDVAQGRRRPMDGHDASETMMGVTNGYYAAAE